jgi:hypothetical protein
MLWQMGSFGGETQTRQIAASGDLCLCIVNYELGLRARQANGIGLYV